MAAVLLLTAATGFVMGLSLRAPAVIMATLVMIFAGIAVSFFLTASWSNALIRIFWAIVVLQLAYLAGAMTIALAHRRRDR